MITKQTLEKLRSTQQKPYFGSQAEAMFIDGRFNPENWNGGDGIIRQYCYQFDWDNDKRVYEIDYMINGQEHSGDVIVQWAHFQDNNYLTIIVHGYNCKDQDGDWYTKIYLVQWYKSRGNTSLISLNGSPITEDEYIDLLNLIERTGFKFNLENE